ncbi:hypothetical protein L1987_29893 [Smallanthus sonchifolius]|uniref:Uncharacterized protein n=1 Tax=Smallanthus sonchifolius TaxID=185202 RepID=A0ACB9I178_9ASTR|nr:hypothetical protein L1987_29893 [Smallanthus sonchifolius]
MKSIRELLNNDLGKKFREKKKCKTYGAKSPSPDLKPKPPSLDPKPKLSEATTVCRLVGCWSRRGSPVSSWKRGFGSPVTLSRLTKAVVTRSETKIVRGDHCMPPGRLLESPWLAGE